MVLLNVLLEHEHLKATAIFATASLQCFVSLNLVKVANVYNYNTCT